MEKGIWKLLRELSLISNITITTQKKEKNRRQTQTQNWVGIRVDSTFKILENIRKQNIKI